MNLACDIYVVYVPNFVYHIYHEKKVCRRGKNKIEFRNTTYFQQREDRELICKSRDEIQVAITLVTKVFKRKSIRI